MRNPVLLCVIGLIGASSASAADQSRSRSSTFEHTITVKRAASPIVACSEAVTAQEDFAAALSLCDKAAAADPLNSTPQYYRGFALAFMERFTEAEAAFTAAISLNTSRVADSYFQRGLVRERLNRREDALADFRRADQMNPGSMKIRRKLEEYGVPAAPAQREPG